MGQHDALKAPEFGAVVAASRAGDRAAVTMMLALLRPVMMQYCRSRLPYSSQGWADDIVQEICLGVLGAIARYTGPPDQFRLVAYRIASNKLVYWRRKRGRDKSCRLADMPGARHRSHAPGPSPEHLATHGDLVARLQPAMLSLPSGQRAVLALRYLADLSFDEIGARLGVSSAAARCAHHRAIRTLRTHTAELDVP